ncbi:MAG: hypothetical protein IKC24_06295 [Oscillospiraceae bacterium]|nr:hypothetical protein [Oscillospiraceae bacterium]
MSLDNRLNVRFLADVPLLRYIVPFSYGHNNVKYEEAVARIMNTGEWRVANRSDIVPSHEEDLYNHVYCSFIDSALDPDGGGVPGNNIGAGFIPLNFKRKGMYYHYHEKESAKQTTCAEKDTKADHKAVLVKGKYDPTRRILNFTIVNEGIFLFRTGVGFYWYEVKLPEMDVDHLVLFQNRFKELNAIRLTKSVSDKFWFCDKKDPGGDKFTLGTQISLKLNDIFKDVNFYPPRINEVVRNKMAEENRKRWRDYEKAAVKEWENKEFAQQKEGSLQNSEEYRAKLDAYHKENQKWENMTISHAQKIGFLEGYPMVVPDRAILYSYVVFYADKDAESEAEKQKLIGDMCKYAYYISRGYKESYKVTKNAEAERAQMFFRHENDVWDASLEGIGCFVSIYERVYNKDGSLKSNTFYDKNRVKEMKGDYFILYLLLLYQHYTLILFFQIVSNKFSFKVENYLEYSQRLYDEIYAFKVSLDIFLSGSVFEAVSHTTDICNLYSYVENKMRIRDDYENLKRSVSNLESLQNCLLEKKKESDEAFAAAEKDDFDKALGIGGVLIGGLTVVSCVNDAVDLSVKAKDYFALTNEMHAILMWALLALILIIVIMAMYCIIWYFRSKKKRRAERKNKKERFEAGDAPNPEAP